VWYSKTLCVYTCATTIYIAMLSGGPMVIKTKLGLWQKNESSNQIFNMLWSRYHHDDSPNILNYQ
jgi:hypothetical protein